jgi:predicted transcriptional regulator
MGLSLDRLDPPLDDIAFLARSNNRVLVMDELRDDALTRRELRDRVGVSKPTLGRVLEGFEERGWVRTNGDRTYELTPVGGLLASSFDDLMDTVEATQELRELAPALPLESMDFDLDLLADATITTPSPTDASAHVRREAELLERTASVRFLCNQANPPTVEQYRDLVVDGGLELEAVITGDAIAAAATDEAMRPALEDLVACERATIHRTDDPVDVMLGLLDDTATIVPLDDTGVPLAFIEAESDPIREWVRATLDAHEAAGELLTGDGLPPA